MSVGKHVVIWRSLLLPGSETFIRNQGGNLTEWRPTYLGALRIQSPLTARTDVIAYPDGLRGRVAFLLLRLTGGSRRLRGLLTGLRPAVVHAHFAGDGWLISRSAVRAGAPLIITLHGLDVTKQPTAAGMRGSRYRRNLRTAFDRATVILAVSEFIRGRAIALGADPAKVRVHHTGVPLPPVPDPVEPASDLLFVGRFVEKKGIDDLIEAVGLLPEPRPRLVLIGAGPLEETMRRRAEALGLDATFLGSRDSAEVSRRMAESRIFVSPSKTAADGDSEGLPTTILEAAGHGLPTVSTHHSGIPEAVVHGETGLLGAEGDPAALAANIALLLADEELRARLGKQARAHVEANFDLAKQTRLLEALYDTVSTSPRA
ncbi:glycosyltransferase involved in cell wall biosynthesis [Allocatelliglobosispora scoriae]|uniref:Glycosyltransferase involved in cell wall biosynthesis n=1 Tax=Allocatelliglobosispora scoriae TaxID=643052 RepID=A0A841BZ38_9ACTN|nr:glycosyltransferase [Allocatelliglobosispora scoriae]MBB5872758.1 glycosyltransferase involved in cell wall biosynthesis [Allocatelliglobosispora scoriae]